MCAARATRLVVGSGRKYTEDCRCWLCFRDVLRGDRDRALEKLRHWTFTPRTSKLQLFKFIHLSFLFSTPTDRYFQRQRTTYESRITKDILKSVAKSRSACSTTQPSRSTPYNLMSLSQCDTMTLAKINSTPPDHKKATGSPGVSLGLQESLEA